MTVVWFVVAAAAGSVARHHVNRLGFGWLGTLAVNVVGAFVLGLVATRWPDGDALTVVGTGFCGSLTTYSMFALEVVDEPVRRRWTVVAATLVLGLGAAAVGAVVG